MAYENEQANQESELEPKVIEANEFVLRNSKGVPKDFNDLLPEGLLVTPNPYVIVLSRVKNEALLALLSSWDNATEEEIEAQRATWTEIKTALDAERATGRKIFAED